MVSVAKRSKTVTLRDYQNCQLMRKYDLGLDLAVFDHLTQTEPCGPYRHSRPSSRPRLGQPRRTSMPLVAPNWSLLPTRMQELRLITTRLKISREDSMTPTRSPARLAKNSMPFISSRSNKLSEDLTVMACQRGLHCLVEKPMAATLEGANRMLAAAEAAE